MHRETTVPQGMLRNRVCEGFAVVWRQENIYFSTDEWKKTDGIS